MNAFRNRHQKSTPVKADSAAPKKPDESLRAFSQWLLLVPLVIFLLFLCGQLSLLTGKRIASASTESKLSAEYEPWYSIFIRPISPEIAEEAISDRTLEAGGAGGPDETSGQPWVDPTSQLALTSVAAPALATSPTSAVGGAGVSTQPGQPTDTPIVPAPSATAFLSPTPTQTSTSPPPTQPATSTPTQPPPPGTGQSTYWLSSDRDFNLYRLTREKPNGAAASGGINIIFSTGPLSSGTKLKSGTVTLNFYAQNSNDKKAEIGFFISPGPGSKRALGGDSISIPANTVSPTLFSKSFSMVAYEFAEGETLQLHISPGLASVHWDGPWNDARIELPLMAP